MRICEHIASACCRNSATACSKQVTAAAHWRSFRPTRMLRSCLPMSSFPMDWTVGNLPSEAQRRRPGLRVLFTTGYTRNAVIHNGRLEPGVHMIGKPFTFAELAARVRAILDAI